MLKSLKLLAPWLLRAMLILGVSAAATYLAACLFVRWRQSRFIFLPSANLEVTPELYDLHYQDVWLPIPKGAGKAELHGWWIPALDPAAGVILYLHGNGINIGANAAQAHRFHQLGLSVFLIDYRGYGRSNGGFPTEAKVYQDAEAAWQYLVQERQVHPKQIFVYGHSLGGAIAIDLALKHPEAAGIIVQGTFTSMRDMANLKGWDRLFPVKLLLTQRFNSLDKVKALQLPVLFIHGENDDQVPAQMSQLLYAAAPEPKQLALYPLARHNDVGEVGGGHYLQTILKFVHQSQASRQVAET